MNDGWAKIETWRFAGPRTQSTNTVTLPKMNFRYKILSLCVRMVVGSTPGNTYPSFVLLDGDGLPIAQYAVPAAGTAAAAAMIVTTFGLGIFEAGNGTAVVLSGGRVLQMWSLADELWVVPGDQIQVNINGATAGVSGVGDDWLDTTLRVARL